MANPRLTLAVVLAVALVGGYYASRVTFDASSETLVQRDDPSLAYFESFSERFHQAPTLLLTYTPHDGALFSAHHLQHLSELQQRLERVPGVSSVTSILDLPLIESPPVPLVSMRTDFRTLRSADVDLTLAHQELSTSPVFRDLLVSADGGTTALAIALDDAGGQSQRAESVRRSRDRLIEAVRDIRNDFASQATLYLGGVPMVAADMITYVRQDMQYFGLAIVALVAVCLYAFFRRLRWVLIPLATTSVALLLTFAVIGFVDQPLTVISSNFVPIQVIVAISFAVHLISRYRELRHNDPERPQLELVAETMSSKFAPCAYTALTTIVAFASLASSDILPVVQFAWIMCLAVVISLVVTYLLFPALLLVLPKGRAAATLGRQWMFTRLLAAVALNWPRLLLAAAVLSAVLAAGGVWQLGLGNRVTDYFRDGTEIHDGMVFIDRNLGGTIPLDVVIAVAPYRALGAGDDEDIFAMEDVDDPFPERYWFTPEMLSLVSRIHDYLEARPEIGKVVSLSSLDVVARRFNDGEPLNYVELTAALGLVPENIRANLIEPYASPNSGELRLSARVRETGADFSRDALLEDIRDFVAAQPEMSPDRVRLTGMVVLFNDMLQRLLDSQVSTIAIVVLLTFGMFALLLRSIRLAVVGLLPNLLAAFSILGVMGWLGIPLDMMTITIAAIVVGIGVDDAIHYLHRYRREVAAGRSPAEAVVSVHGSIGHALYYTSITVMIGFSVLVLSNFVPAIHFGILSAIAMPLALLANLTILPAMLLVGSRSTGSKSV